MLQVVDVALQPLLKTWRQVNVVLFVRRRVQKQGIRTFSEDVAVVLEHDLSIAIRMQQRNDVQTVHLPQELSHVGGSCAGKQHKLEVNTLNLGFSVSHLVLQQLEQNVVLVQVQLRKAFQVWVEEVAEEQVALERQTVVDFPLLRVKFKSSRKRPHVVLIPNLVLRIISVLYLLVSLLDHLLDETSDLDLSLDGLL